MPEIAPYLPRHPGDPITAEDWNDLQTRVQGDIDAKVTAAKEDIKKTGVDHAGDADTFAHRSDTEWKTELDQRYAAKSHDHEGPAVYRRYIKEFTTDPGLDRVLIRHNLARYPLVDLYELLDATNGANDTGGCKLFFYYGHADEETYGLSARVGRERVRLGLPFEQVLAELGAAYTDDSSLGDVLNDMWDAFRKEPNDEIKHCTSPWVEACCGEARTVAELKRTQQWDDLYLALKPRKRVGLGGDGSRNEANPVDVDVAHIDYATLALKVTGLNADRPALDLMILLRG